MFGDTAPPNGNSINWYIYGAGAAVLAYLFLGGGGNKTKRNPRVKSKFKRGGKYNYLLKTRNDKPEPVRIKIKRKYHDYSLGEPGYDINIETEELNAGGKHSKFGLKDWHRKPGSLTTYYGDLGQMPSKLFKRRSILHKKAKKRGKKRRR